MSSPRAPTRLLGPKDIIVIGDWTIKAAKGGCTADRPVTGRRTSWPLTTTPSGLQLVGVVKDMGFPKGGFTNPRKVRKLGQGAQASSAQLVADGHAEDDDDEGMADEGAESEAANGGEEEAE